ncbi:MAG TPA: putative collagen-binding domain-containing protein [Abditibacteriaceae bacterium]
MFQERPFFSRVPAWEMLSKTFEGAETCATTRYSEGHYVDIYSASGRAYELDLTELSGGTLRATWFDPRAGTCVASEEFKRHASRVFSPPTQGKNCEWVWLIDDVSQNFSPIYVQSKSTVLRPTPT